MNPTWLAAIALLGLQQYQAPTASCLPRWSWSPKWCNMKYTYIISISLYNLSDTRSYVALQAADLDWIVGPGYSSGRYFLGCCQRLAPRFRRSARIGSQLTFLRKWRFFVSRGGPSWPFWESKSFLYPHGPNWPPLIQKPNGTYKGPQLTF